MPVFCRLGLPGGIVRYLDDVLALVGIVRANDTTRVQQFVNWLASPEVYPRPLQLNLEAEGDQGFLEARVVKAGTVRTKILNKVVVDILAQRHRYRQRLSTAMPRHQLQMLVTGLVLRAVQNSTAGMQLLLQALIEIRYEALVDAGSDRYFAKAIHNMLKRPNISPSLKDILNTKDLRE